jgi:hypothetical protein
MVSSSQCRYYDVMDIHDLADLCGRQIGGLALTRHPFHPLRLGFKTITSEQRAPISDATGRDHQPHDA